MSLIKPIQVLIVGTGAVGAFYGSRLATCKNVIVSVTCRSNYEAVKADGINMITKSYGDYKFNPHHVFSSIDHVVKSKIEFDFVVLSTKALTELTNDSLLIQPVVAPSTTIVLIQNGLGLEHSHRITFPHNIILSAVTIVSAEQTSPGTIKQNRWTRISIGPFIHELDDEFEGRKLLESSSKLQNTQFVNLLKEGGIADAEDLDDKDLQLVRWHKLAINASMNTSAVLAGRTGNARMALDPELRIHLTGCMNEIFKTAPLVLNRPFPSKLSSVTAEKILKSTERNTGGKPSMLLDWESGRPMELEVILGNPIRIARKRGLEMPRLQTLYALLKMAQTRRDEEAQKSKL